LTGKITPASVFAEGSFQDFYFKGDRKAEVERRAAALGFLLHEQGDTLAQAALRYCLSNPAVSTVITGMRKPNHAQENAKASDKGALAPADLAKIKEHAWPHNYWA
jgi:aryl-alcohol dehydrogenase-like predicted oxidoreductase